MAGAGRRRGRRRGAAAAAAGRRLRRRRGALGDPRRHAVGEPGLVGRVIAEAGQSPVTSADRAAPARQGGWSERDVALVAGGVRCTREHSRAPLRSIGARVRGAVRCGEEVWSASLTFPLCMIDCLVNF